MKEFDYYIFIDFSENLLGYSIIENKKLKELLQKISRFRHYKDAENRKLYLKNVKKTIKRENIELYFSRLKIREFRQYSAFRKIIKIVSEKNIVVKQESELVKGTPEYQASLVLDNLLNIERLKQ